MSAYRNWIPLSQSACTITTRSLLRFHPSFTQFFFLQELRWDFLSTTVFKGTRPNFQPPQGGICACCNLGDYKIGCLVAVSAEGKIVCPKKHVPATCRSISTSCPLRGSVYAACLASCAWPALWASCWRGYARKRNQPCRPFSFLLILTGSMAGGEGRQKKCGVYL